MKVSLKSVSTILFFAGFLCAILLITHKTFGFDAVLKIGFYVGGGLGLILNLYLARPGQPEAKDFNLLFWIGTVLIYLGLLFRLLYLPFDTYIIIGGVGVTGVSYFYNPFAQDSEADNEELLDN